MKNKLRYLPLAIIIIVTYMIIYILTNNQVNGWINFIVMILLVSITDNYYLTKINESNMNFICKSFIWVFAILFTACLAYNLIRGRLISDINIYAVVIVLTFLVLSALIIYSLFYKIVNFIKLLLTR